MRATLYKFHAHYAKLQKDFGPTKISRFDGATYEFVIGFPKRPSITVAF